MVLRKYKTELNLNSIFKTEAPQLLKHFLLTYVKQERQRIRAALTKKIFFAAPDNFDIENFDEVVSTLFVKRKRI